MAKETKIAWANGTFNPWRGCTKVSAACQNCYAENWAKRTGKDIWGPTAAREHAAESYWKQPVKWNRDAAASGQPFRVFCSSLADVCEDREDLLAPRARLMRLIEATPALTWLLCTKRPENFGRFFGVRWGLNWPKNVWALTTAEDNEQAEKRIPHLLTVPAVVRGVSYEPALGPVNFRSFILRQVAEGEHAGKLVQGLNWIIFGGESGAGARKANLDWARSVRDQCQDLGAAFFMKQLGNALARGHGYSSSKGDQVEEWPTDLQRQEFPTPA